jgi:hypothetical protein
MINLAAWYTDAWNGSMPKFRWQPRATATRPSVASKPALSFGLAFPRAYHRFAQFSTSAAFWM